VTLLRNACGVDRVLSSVPKEWTSFNEICNVDQTYCLGAFVILRKVTIGRIFMKFDIEDFSKICRENSFHEHMTRITGTLHEDQFTFGVISR
jgi:hypothetical protein